MARVPVMGTLFVLLQLVTVYISVMVVIGIARHPEANALHAVLVGSQFFGLCLIVRLCHVAQRSLGSAPVNQNRFHKLAVTAVLAIVTMTLGAFALIRGAPSEVSGAPDALYMLAVELAGRWAVALFFYVIAAMFSVSFFRTYRQRPK